MAISLTEARNIFTQAYIAKFEQLTPAPSFLKSFFNTTTTNAKNVSIAVRRDNEMIAVDVLRGVDGNRNNMTKSSFKLITPAFYNESFDHNALDRYDEMWDGTSINPSIVGMVANDAANNYARLRAKIERAKELQCSQVLQTGVVELESDTNIDFGRRAQMMVDAGSGNYWETASTDIEQQLIDAGNAIRTYGKIGVKELNIIMSSKAFKYLKASEFFSNVANYFQTKLLDIRMPQADAFGGCYYGTISAGSFTYHIWLYDEVYTTSLGVVTRYTDEEKVIIIPMSGYEFQLAHGGVPAIIKDVTNSQFGEFVGMMDQEYYMNNYIDIKSKTQVFELLSAPIAVPVTVDAIYTLKVLGDSNPNVK